ncbi:hypothetical protein QC762_0022210 [Podospora pseudocomata]|uniref:NACHT domain-containing protein n=1 Tax=Podospora pseudocomata TaxID=2093779 RepID=A0ABR0GYK8_9PEZI|nr:hypothetical protein QC762_0022210 [Podospora pseudocomata]
MAGSLRKRFGLFRWKKESREKSKAQDGPEIHGSIASANSSEVSVLRPEQAASSTTVTPSLPQSTINASQTPAPAVPPTPSSKTLPVLSNTSDKAAKAPQTATDGQAVEIGENLVAYVSLWDRAYDALKEEEPDRVTEYEQLLSRVLIRVPSISQLASNQTDDVKIANQVPQNDPIARRKKLKEITELGLKHMEDKKVSTTLLGHEIVLQDVVAKVAGAVEWVEGHVKDAIKDLPYASIVMAGVSLVLPLLKNPAAAEEANRDGFTYVTSQMRYFAAMESLLLPQDTKPDLKDDLTERLVDLYKLIIDFQVQSVIRFYRTQTKNFFRGAINYDGWDQKLQYIKDTDVALVSRFETTMSASRLQVLRDLAGRAEESRIALNSLLAKVQEHIEVSRQQLGVLQKISQHITDPQDHACLQGLRITDPHDDKSRIEQAKGGLLTGSYCWVLDNDDFRQWRNNQDSRLLWIKGDPGKGKTMLLCGIIDELTKSIPNTTTVSFFFCQATDARINNATAVLRGLIFLLVSHQPSLISHVRQRYDQAGKQLFEDANAWEALSKIFTNILEDPHLQSTYLVIDALDECTGDLSRLLNFIAKTSSTYSDVKWIVSSRNWPNIEKGLDDATQKVRLCLELNEESVSAAVANYIQSKVDLLAKQNQYDNDTRDAVRAYLSSNAYGTFLWVALVCQELAGISGWEAEEMLTALPPGLDALYERMMSQICSSRNSQLCKNILAVVSVVRRPITLDELPSLVDMPPRCSGSRDVLAEIVGLCGSFLTLRDHTIAFVHQSAKDFLVQKASREIFPSGIQHVHRSIFSRSLRVLANILRRDIYGLSAPGFPIDQVKQPNPDPLAAARYSCVYWIDHLSECDATRDEVESIDRFLRRSYLYWLEALSLLQGHGDLVWSVVFSPDGQRVASGSGDRTIKIWDTASGTCTQTLEGHGSSVLSVAFSPDGQRVASGSRDKTIKIWDTASGSCTQTLEGHGSWVLSVGFSPDGQRVASGSGDRTIKIWDTASGSCTQTLEGHGDFVLSVAFSRDGQRVASGSDDNTIKIWDTASGSCTQTLEGHGDLVWSVAFSPDGQRMASGSDDKTIKIWDTASGSCTQTINVGLTATHLSFDHANAYINTNIGRIQIATATMESPN